MFVENLLCSRHSGYVNSSLSLSSVFHLQSTSSLTDSLTNKTFISVHGFLPFLIYIYLVSLTSSNSILFFFFLITPKSTATGSQEPFRVNGILLRGQRRWETYGNLKPVSHILIVSLLCSTRLPGTLPAILKHLPRVMKYQQTTKIGYNWI